MPDCDERGGGRQAVGEARRRPRSRRTTGTSRPSLRCIHTAVAGNGVSPVIVAHTIMSSCSAGMPADSSAPRAASTARSEVCTPSSAKWRASMPVRSRIHSSLVSTMASNQLLGTSRGGSAEPTPAMVAYRVTAPRISDRGSRCRRRTCGDGARSRAGERAAAASGEPTATAVASGTTRFASFVSTSPGPGLQERVAPAAASARAHASQRTGETT